MERRLWILLPLATVGLYATWGGLMNMIVARQVAELVPDPRASAGMLGSIMAVGATIALIAQPLLGGVSDRTRIRFLGRRNIWIIGGGLGAAAGLILLALNSSLNWLPVLFALTVFPLSGAHAALTTILPERVPLHLQGKMSGLNGSMTTLGFLIGVTIGGVVATTQAGYLLLAILLVVSLTIFGLATEDPPHSATSGTANVGLLRSVFGNLPRLRSHQNFWWTFASRFLVLLGYNVVTGFNLYLLKDYIGFGGGDVATASREVAKVMTLSTSMLFLFSIIGGFICDATGKVRIFVIGASLILVPTSIVYLTVPTLTGFYIAQAIMGAAFGLYMAVDYVLIARVLPSTQSAGRDLGVLNIANSGPQAAAPVVAGAIVALTGNYSYLFLIMAVAAVLSAMAVTRIRSVE